jgi:hypothetical protein
MVVADPSPAGGLSGAVKHAILGRRSLMQGAPWPSAIASQPQHLRRNFVAPGFRGPRGPGSVRWLACLHLSWRSAHGGGRSQRAPRSIRADPHHLQPYPPKLPNPTREAPLLSPTRRTWQNRQTAVIHLLPSSTIMHLAGPRNLQPPRPQRGISHQSSRESSRTLSHGPPNPVARSCPPDVKATSSLRRPNTRQPALDTL